MKAKTKTKTKTKKTVVAKVTKPTQVSKRKLARLSAKMLHDEWSLAVRKRDNFSCLLCGSKKTVQGHHWYVGKRAVSALAHDVDNGATLCLYCHQVLAHKQGTYRTHARIRAAMVTVLGIDRFNQLVTRAANAIAEVKDAKR